MPDRLEAASDAMSEEPRRLYRGLTKPYDPARAHATRSSGTDFTDCPLTALGYAQGPRGVVLVVDVPVEHPRLHEALWLGTSAKRFMICGSFDELLVGAIPAKQLRTHVRRRRVVAEPDDYKALVLRRAVNEHLRTAAIAASRLGPSTMRERSTPELRASRGVFEGPLEADEEEDVARFLKTGEYDEAFASWQGQNFFAKCIRGTEAMEDALVAEVARRSGTIDVAHRMPDVDVNGLARAKVTPMVSGLFPAAEREIVLRLLERSLVFLTPDNIADVLRSRSFLGSAWTVANLYLGSIGAEARDLRLRMRDLLAHPRARGHEGRP